MGNITDDSSFGLFGDITNEFQRSSDDSSMTIFLGDNIKEPDFEPKYFTLRGDEELSRPIHMMKVFNSKGRKSILPFETLVNIFLFSEPRDIFNLTLACRRFKLVLYSNQFWRLYYYHSCCGQNEVTEHDINISKEEVNWKEKSFRKILFNSRRSFSQRYLPIAVGFEYEDVLIYKDDHFKRVSYRITIVGSDKIGKLSFIRYFEMKPERNEKKNNYNHILFMADIEKNSLLNLNFSIFNKTTEKKSSDLMTFSDGIFLCFSIDDRKSFQTVVQFCNSIDLQVLARKRRVSIILLGLRMDERKKEKERKVSLLEIKNFIHKNNQEAKKKRGWTIMGYVECQAFKNYRGERRLRNAREAICFMVDCLKKMKKMYHGFFLEEEERKNKIIERKKSKKKKKKVRNHNCFDLIVHMIEKLKISDQEKIDLKKKIGMEEQKIM